MSEETPRRPALRNAKEGVTAMPMPSGSGAMLTCKIPVKLPLPCTVILVHGVNDDGHCFPKLDEGICQGLNERLGRDDLFPHEWEAAPDYMTSTGAISVPALKIKCEGRSPVIPFHWGYRPVDLETYRQDQQRYQAELVSKKAAAELPYGTYFRSDTRAEAQAGYACKDNLGNWLNDKFAKNGGTFSNATTNLPDMWGPGTSGDMYDGVARQSRTRLLNGGDFTHPMYDNPHRIYMIHAAQRLADLIIQIRVKPKTKDDTINIVAHSQGTLITILANLLVSDAGLRPVDCVILCHSPYGLALTAAESVTGGSHQTDQARIETLANFSAKMWSMRQPTPVERMLGWGSAKQASWERPGHNRDNFGMVYNYFCPNDQVVSLLSVQGMGWQGVPDDTLAKFGPNFRQRAFAQGRLVGEASAEFSMPLQYDGRGVGHQNVVAHPADTAKHAANVAFGQRRRMVNADALPQPFEFKLQSGSDAVKDDIAETSLAAAGSQLVSRLVDNSTGVETDLKPGDVLPGTPVPTDADTVQCHLSAKGWPYQVIKAWYFLADSRYMVKRYESRDEALKRISQGTVEFSQHSSIVENQEVAQKAMAYDLAIGGNAAFEYEDIWWQLLYRADWRHPKNPDGKAKRYYTLGLLPKEMKLAMNHPGFPDGVVNQYITPVKSIAFAAKLMMAPETISSNDFGQPLQWPMPKPDVKA